MPWGSNFEIGGKYVVLQLRCCVFEEGWHWRRPDAVTGLRETQTNDAVRIAVTAELGADSARQLNGLAYHSDGSYTHCFLAYESTRA